MTRLTTALDNNHPQGRGCLQCPWCRSFTTTRIKQTDKKLKGAVRRKHVCLNCNKSFGTEERVVKPVANTQES